MITTPLDLTEVRSKERIRDLGEVFTPQATVTRMLNILDPGVWSDPSVVFVESSCGDGAFLVQVLAGLLAYHQPIEALARLRGCDISDTNVRACRANLARIALQGVPADSAEVAMVLAAVTAAVKCGNGLEYNPNEHLPLCRLPYLPALIEHCLLAMVGVYSPGLEFVADVLGLTVGLSSPAENPAKPA